MSDDTRVAFHIGELIKLIDNDPNRDGLRETPARVARAYAEWFGGYDVDDRFKTFDVEEKNPGLVTVSKIPFYSHCEHHMAPFFGDATIIYRPDKRVAGLSKFARVVDKFARRLQIQERLTADIVSYLYPRLEPVSLCCLIRARHLCIESRGVRSVGSHTITSSIHLSPDYQNHEQTDADMVYYTNWISSVTE